MADITEDLVALRRAADTGLNWLTSPDQVRRVVDECERLQKDSERLEWILPIVTGEDNPTADARALALAAALIRGLDGLGAIDAAMQGKASHGS